MTIERWFNAYSVPVDHPDPEDLRARLDRLIRAQVLDACRRRLDPLVSASDPSVWLIRRLDVELILDASAFAADRTGAAWGEQLALELLRVLDGGPRGDEVLRFRDRPAFVAQWVRDAVAGRASGKWYYAEFDSLGSLPASAAIAEAIMREGEAEEILQRLHAQEALEPVLAILTHRDAERLCDRVLPRTEARRTGSVRWVARLLAIWNSVALGRDRGDVRNALRLFVAAKAEWPGGDAEEFLQLGETLLRLLELRRTLAWTGARDRTLAFLEALIAGDEQRARALVPGALWTAGLAPFVHSSAGGDRQWAQFVLPVLTPDFARLEECATEAPGTTADTSFLSELGGVFLLASAFVDMGIDEALRAAARSCVEPLRAEPALRCLFAMRCLGRNRAALAAGDPAIALFANAQRAPSLHEMAEAQAQADAEAALDLVMERWTARTEQTASDVLLPEHADYFRVGSIFTELQLEDGREQAWVQMASAVLRNFARRLPGFGKSSPEYLFRNFLSGTSRVRADSRRIEVRLPESPLTVVLRMAGAYRTLTVPWREGVEICLLGPAS